MTGKITKLDKAGWGFISSRDKPFTRIFFHWSALSPLGPNFLELHKGMVVEFEVMELEGKGWRAIKIIVQGVETSLPKEMKEAETERIK